MDVSFRTSVFAPIQNVQATHTTGWQELGPPTLRREYSVHPRSEELQGEDTPAEAAASSLAQPARKPCCGECKEVLKESLQCAARIIAACAQIIRTIDGTGQAIH